MNPAPMVALVGNPNAGKSALFNRLVDVRPDLAQRMAGTMVDPFMRDEVIGDCLDWLELVWHMDGNDDSIWTHEGPGHGQ